MSDFVVRRRPRAALEAAPARQALPAALAPSSPTAAGVGPGEEELSPAAAAAVQRGWAAATRRAYDTDWAAFTAWCAARGRSPLPATGATLAEYITELTRRAPRPAPTSLNRLIGSIQARHKAADLAVNAKPARMVLRGYHRDWAQDGGRATQARAVSTDELRKMLRTRPGDDLRCLRDRALVTLGYAMMGRRSELAGLDIRDLTFSDDGLEVFLAISKADRDSAGQTVQVTYGTHRLTCAVRTVGAYTAALAAAGITAGPLLRGIDRRGRPGGTPGATLRGPGRISGDGINKLVQDMAEEAGLTGVSAHSLRAGPATHMARRGARRVDIAAQGRWNPRSTAIDSYIRAAEGWEHNPLRLLDL